MDEPIRIRDVTVLAQEYGVLARTVFDQKRRDGTWQTLTRETYDRGNGAAILLHDPARGLVLLTRQFRYPAYVNGHPAPMLEVVAGMLDDDSPEAAIRREAEEEAGCTITAPRHLFDAFMSPGALTERLSLFVASYDSASRGAGGGLASEGEDIAVLELPLTDALDMVTRGEIVDAKTIMLLQWARLNGLPDAGADR